MHNFPGEVHQIMQNGYNHFVFINPNYFHPPLPLYPLNNALYLRDRKENTVFPNQTSFSPQIITQNREGPSQNQVSSTQKPTKIKKEKKVQSDEEQDDEEQEFKIKTVKNRSSFSGSYKKKNTQSNIVNQTFSFLSSEKSKKIVERYFKENQSKVEDYYKVMTKIKQGNKKYINRFYLKKLISFDQKSQFDRAFLKAKVKELSKQQMKKTLRVLLFHFMRSQVSLSMLTSCKIYKETLPEHFWRRRQVLKFLFEKFYGGE